MGTKIHEKNESLKIYLNNKAVEKEQKPHKLTENGEGSGPPQAQEGKLNTRYSTTKEHSSTSSLTIALEPSKHIIAEE